VAELDIGILGASKVGPTGSPVWQPQVPLSDDEQDLEGFGECVPIQSLGISSMPWPKDENGYAEAVFARNCGGRDAVCLGARDTRSSKIVGNLKPGDTVVHCTGPSQAAQLQLKEEKRQAVLVTKTFDDETMAVVLDGKNGKFQIAASGAMFEIDKDGGITLTDSTGKAGIRVANGQVNVFGTVVLGGGTPNPALKIMLGAGPSTGGIATIPMFPAMGVFIGL
jgi:hypothetical protein